MRGERGHVVTLDFLDCDLGAMNRFVILYAGRFTQAG